MDGYEVVPNVILREKEDGTISKIETGSFVLNTPHGKVFPGEGVSREDLEKSMEEMIRVDRRHKEWAEKSNCPLEPPAQTWAERYRNR